MKVRLFIICLALSFPFLGKSTESPNYPFVLITEDSIKISSVPFCEFGDFGQTRLFDLKSNNQIKTINRYFRPNTCVSKQGLYFAELGATGVRIYKYGELQRVIQKSEVIELEVNTLVMLPGNKKHIYSGDNWIVESFFIEDVFYALLVDGRLAKIHTDTSKVHQTSKKNKLTFEEYNDLKSESNEIIREKFIDFEIPDKESVEKNEKQTIDDMIRANLNNDVNISFVVFFNNCRPQLREYFETLDRPVILMANHDFQPPLNNINREYIYYDEVKKIVENSLNWDCSLKEKKWAFSYVVRREN